MIDMADDSDAEDRHKCSQNQRKNHPILKEMGILPRIYNSSQLILNIAIRHIYNFLPRETLLNEQNPVQIWRHLTFAERTTQENDVIYIYLVLFNAFEWKYIISNLPKYILFHDFTVKR